MHYTARHCITLQHTATHCSTLQHTATHCNTLPTHCNQLQHTKVACSARARAHARERSFSLSHTFPHRQVEALSGNWQKENSRMSHGHWHVTLHGTQAEALSGNVTIETNFFDGNRLLAKSLIRVYYDWRFAAKWSWRFSAKWSLFPPSGNILAKESHLCLLRLTFVSCIVSSFELECVPTIWHFLCKEPYWIFLSTDASVAAIPGVYWEFCEVRPGAWK